MKIIKVHFNKDFKQIRFVASFLFLSFIAAFSGQAQVLTVSDSIQVQTVFPHILSGNWFNPKLWFDPVQDSIQREDQLAGQPLREQITTFAMNFIGRPYRSSGKSPKAGFDCSGFTGYIFKNFGMRLKSSSTAQATEGKKVAPHQAKTGDLAFFGRKDRKGRYHVNHAAIVISKPGEPLAIIHSASNKGIVITNVEESRYWRNALLFVRNVL